MAARFISLISPKGLGWFSQLDLLGDSRMYRALSLLLLDILTITSATKPTNLLVDFVPFAVGAMVVLCEPPPPLVYLSTNRAVPVAFNSGSPKEKEAAPSLWSYYNETRRFALHPTPAPSMAPTLSIRRMSERTTHTVPLPSPDLSEHEPPPAPTRSALSLRVALRNFITQEQENSRAVIDGRTMVKAESSTLPSPETVQSRRSTRSSVRGLFPIRSENPGTQSARQSFRKGKRPQMALFINPEEAPQLPESSATSDSGFYAPDPLPTPRKRSNRTKRSSTSSGLTYMTPNSQKIMPSRRPSYLLSPSRSYQQSMTSTPHTPIPTWEDLYRQHGLQFDPRNEIPPVPSRSDSLNHQSSSSRTSVVPAIPFIAWLPMPPPPGLTRFQPITRPSLLANTPPTERTRGIRGPRPLVTTSKPRNRT